MMREGGRLGALPSTMACSNNYIRKFIIILFIICFYTLDLDILKIEALQNCSMYVYFFMVKNELLDIHTFNGGGNKREKERERENKIKG